MSKRATAYGLKRIAKGDGHAVVVLHGIRQTRDDIEPFANMVAKALPDHDVYAYGYNYTLALERSGRTLSAALDSEIPKGRIDLVGYSMGGLVARLAASDAHPSRIHTVVTLATPNRGSLSNAELSTLGQVGLSALTRLQPLSPRSPGILDLTRAAKIMSNRRDTLMALSPGIEINADQRRYASIPGLFYSEHKADFEFGPSMQLSGLQAVFLAARLKARLDKMSRAHDGIVTERSNNISTNDSEDWTEVHLVDPGTDDAPARCHAVTDTCRDHDHISIIKDRDIATLAAALIQSPDWRSLRKTRADLRRRVRLYPFDCD